MNVMFFLRLCLSSVDCFLFVFFFAEAIYKRQDDSVYFYFPELSIRKDNSGYTAITVLKTSQLIGITDGLCGNANGDPAGNSNGGREVGKKVEL